MNWFTFEPFDNLNINAERLYGLAKHVRLNKFGRTESIHIKPPQPKTGESRCDSVLCPTWIPDGTTCYRCF